MSIHWGPTEIGTLYSDPFELFETAISILGDLEWNFHDIHHVQEHFISKQLVYYLLYSTAIQPTPNTFSPSVQFYP
jgi:hypothetical protein